MTFIFLNHRKSSIWAGVCRLLISNAYLLVMAISLDRGAAGYGACCPAHPTATEGDLHYHHPTSTWDQAPVLYHIHCPNPETYRTSANPGTSSSHVWTTCWVFLPFMWFSRLTLLLFWSRWQSFPKSCSSRPLWLTFSKLCLRHSR